MRLRAGREWSGWDAAERGAGVLLTIALVPLHWVSARHAGGLWRDEVVSAQVAFAPDLQSLWWSLPYESSPPLFHLLLRGWGGLGLPVGDAGLRSFGALVGLGVIAALWLAVRRLGGRAPLWSLGLLGVSPLMIRATGSLRGYGLGIALLVLAFAAFRHLGERPDGRRVAEATILGVLAVHALYQNAFFLLALGLGASLAALSTRRWHVLGGAAVAGAAAALSLLVYVPALRTMARLGELMDFDVSPARVLRVLSVALGSAGPWGRAAWVVALFLGAVAAGLRLRRAGPARTETVVLVATLAAATLGFAAFLWILRMPTRPWYYLPLIAFWAVGMDGLWAGEPPRSLQAARIVLALVCGATAWAPSWAALHGRQTTVDLIAGRLGDLADSRDYVVVHPWYCGLVFERYYRGRAPFATVPPLPDLRLQRKDVFRDAMRSTDPMGPLLDALAATLRSGHTVWLVGRLPEAGSGPPPDPGPAPSPLAGWNHDLYAHLWAVRLAFLLREHSVETTAIAVPGEVSGPERLELMRVAGWRD